MFIVTRRAVHAAGQLKAAAPFQKGGLVPVNVHLDVGPGLLQFDKAVERFSRPERKGWGDFLSQTSVTLGTDSNLPIAREFGRINDVIRGARSGRRGTMAGNMLLARTMASLARNAQDKISLIIAIPERRRSERFKVGRVTLDAARNYGPVKIRGAVQISWTVDPAAEFHPV